MKWVSCSTGMIITPNNQEGTLLFKINNVDGLCQGAFYNSHLPNQQDTYIYTFLFDRLVDNNYLLDISIDGRNYTVTNRNSQSISVRHSHSNSCNSTIDFFLYSDIPINLISFFIFNTEYKRNQVIPYQISIPSQLTVNMFTWISSASDIGNSITSYSGYFNDSDPYLDIKIYQNDLLMTCSFTWVGNDSLLNFLCKQNFNQSIGFGGLSFLLKRKYTIQYYYPGFSKIANFNQDYYFIHQINQSDSTVKQFQQREAFSKSDAMMQLEYDLEFHELNQFRLNPKGWYNCNYNFKSILIAIKNASLHVEYTLQYYPNSDNQNDFIKVQECEYKLQWQNNTPNEYFIDMTLIIDTNDTTPIIGYEILNQRMNNIPEPESQPWSIDVKDIATIILMVLLPIFISAIILLIYICIVSPRYYLYPWLTFFDQEDGGDFPGTRDLTPSMHRQHSEILHVVPQQHHQEQQAILQAQ